MQAASAASDQSTDGLCVLCVDDEQLILDGMHALLGHWGCRVYTAQTIQDAWGIFDKEPIQVVLADYQLKQDETGLDLILRMTAENPRVRASLLTAEATPELSEQALKRNVMVLRKPADPKEIRSFLTDQNGSKTPYAAE